MLLIAALRCKPGAIKAPDSMPQILPLDAVGQGLASWAFGHARASAQRLVATERLHPAASFRTGDDLRAEPRSAADLEVIRSVAWPLRSSPDCPPIPVGSSLLLDIRAHQHELVNILILIEWFGLIFIVALAIAETMVRLHSKNPPLKGRFQGLRSSGSPCSEPAQVRAV